mgnify:CR=1 FL=1
MKLYECQLKTIIRLKSKLECGEIYKPNPSMHNKQTEHFPPPKKNRERETWVSYPWSVLQILTLYSPRREAKKKQATMLIQLFTLQR